MRILLLGSFDLANPLRSHGNVVFTCGGDSRADIHVSAQDPDWAEVFRQAHQKGLNFDAVLVCDNVGNRCLPTGIVDCPYFTAFYGIDAPLNEFWQSSYVQLFDLALFDQPEQAMAISVIHPNAHWLPLGVDQRRYLGEQDGTQAAGACFVGVVDERVRPKRSAVLRRVSAMTHVTARGGRGDKWLATEEAARMYRNHQVVLNENLFPGLTTRPLEVMASGGCLLTEGPYPAMTEHFTDFEHLVYYGPDNLEDRLKQLLDDQALRARLSRDGRRAVLDGHTLEHRAARLTSLLEELAKRGDAGLNRPNRPQALHLEGRAMMWAALRWPGKGGRRRLLRAAGRLRNSLELQADSLDTISDAALALISMNRHAEAIPLLRDASQAGRAEDCLRLAQTYWSMGREQRARDVLQSHKSWFPGSIARLGSAGHHFSAASFLVNLGKGITPGFSRKGLPTQCWHGFEHLLEAIAIDPKAAPVWELAGDILAQRGAPNEAHQMYRKASALGSYPELTRKCEQTASEGYL